MGRREDSLKTESWQLMLLQYLDLRAEDRGVISFGIKSLAAEAHFPCGLVGGEDNFRVADNSRISTGTFPCRFLDLNQPHHTAE